MKAITKTGEVINLRTSECSVVREERQLNAGVKLLATYTTKSGRVFQKTYSCWDRGDGYHVGTTVEEVWS